MANPSSILAWKIPQLDKPGGLQSMGSQRVEHDLANKQLINSPKPTPPHTVLIYNPVTPPCLKEHAEQCRFRGPVLTLLHCSPVSL